MTAIPALPSLLLTTVLPGALPGAAPALADTVGDFAALLTPFGIKAPARQGDAGGGKDLPAASPDEEEIDDPLAWFAALPGLPVVAQPGDAMTATAVTVPPSVREAAVVGSGAGTALVGVEATTAEPAKALTPVPAGLGIPVATLPAVDRAPDAAPIVPGEGATLVTPPTSDATARPAITDVQPAIDLPGRDAAKSFPALPIADKSIMAAKSGSEPAPVRPVATGIEATPETNPIVSGPRIAPAAQMFAGAMRRALRDDATPAAVSAAISAPTTDLAPRAVSAAHDAHAPALDMRRGDWPERMIERIEILRDAANAADTRVRLVPDALGAIDVSLKREGDRVQVQFTASQPETRQLLIDAQPKLDALADARGIRLSHGGSAASGDAANQQRQAQQQASQPSAPASARAAEDDTSTDDRVA